MENESCKCQAVWKVGRSTKGAKLVGDVKLRGLRHSLQQLWLVSPTAYATRQARGQIHALRYSVGQQHFEQSGTHLRIAFGQLGTQGSHRWTTSLTRRDTGLALSLRSPPPSIKTTKGNIHLEKVENISASDHAQQHGLTRLFPTL